MKLIKRKNTLGQSSVEYLVLFAVILAALLATGFIGNMRNYFEVHFYKAVEAIAPPVNK